MPNTGYKRSRQREYEAKHQLEKEGWFCTRASGSHGLADVLAVKPTKCGHADHFEVKFVQIKTGYNIKRDNKTVKVEATPAGWEANVEYWNYAVNRKMGKAKSNKKGNNRQANKIRKGNKKPAIKLTSRQKAKKVI